MTARLAFGRAPARVYWEMTRACDLACRHCRAHAAPRAHPAEVTGVEARTLLDDLVRFGLPLPHVVFTGGDPLTRPDPLRADPVRVRAGTRRVGGPERDAAADAVAVGALKAAGTQAISLRDPDHFGGRCGACDFRHPCGGSRARAFAASGDPCAEDPLCPYEPALADDAGA